MRAVKWISKFLSRIEGSLVIFMLTAMIALAFLQVVLRNMFSTGFLWADPFLRHLVLWIGFLGASLATQQEKHINLDIITRFISIKWMNILRSATNLFAAAVTLFLAKAGWIFLQNEMDSLEPLLTIGQTSIPAWWFQLIIPLGFGLMGFRFIIRTIEHVVAIFNPSAVAEPSTNVPTISS